MSTPLLKSPETPILIVDDNEQYAQVLKRILQGVFNFTAITWVDDSSKALELLRAPNQFKLLFIDFRFPSGFTGVQLLGTLADEGLLKGRAAILITSEPSAENLATATAAGALGVVAKPFNREELAKYLERAERHLVMEEGESF
jgi:CheY-like chemotaxis protein